MDRPVIDDSSAAVTRGPFLHRAVGLCCLFGTLLIAGCGGGGDQISVSGTALYQSVPANPSGSLNYAAQTYKPIRGATVQLINTATGAALATAVTAASGAYSFAAVTNPNAPVVVRVRAELQSAVAGGPTTDVTVKDNTSGDALYVLESTPVTVTAATQAIDVQAASGWGGSSYTGARSAAPFAVLDAVYQGVQKVRGAAPNQALPPLQIFWSTRNTNSDGTIALGQIGTSFFSTAHPETRAPGLRIYLLGNASTDADEYDSSVVVHEWGHYLQVAVSRDDSIGGEHSRGDRLDMRVAFSEGFGYAFAGMALGNPLSTDSFTGPQGQLGGSSIDVSSNAFANKGWYSEASVQHLLWTWHQDGRIGFAPLYSVLTGPMRTSGALIGIHHFAQRLKQAQASAATFIDTTLTGQNITVQDEWGTGEANAGGAPGALPLYTSLSGLTRVCVSDASGQPNKLRNYAYLRFSTGAGNFTVRVQAAGATGTDPDFEVVMANGVVDQSLGTDQDIETKVVALPAGTHSLVVNDFKLTNNLTQEGERCFNVTVN